MTFSDDKTGFVDFKNCNKFIAVSAKLTNAFGK
jgi:hypothetical protein